MSESLVELLVEVPGLPAQIGQFRRESSQRLVLVEPITWVATAPGKANTMRIASPKGQWSFWGNPGDLHLSPWTVGCTICLTLIELQVPGSFTIDEWLSFVDHHHVIFSPTRGVLRRSVERRDGS